MYKTFFIVFRFLFIHLFCMFAVLHIWCLMFYDFVTYLHPSLHVSLHFHELFIHKFIFWCFFFKKQFWQGMKRACLFLPNKICYFSTLNGMLRFLFTFLFYIRKSLKLDARKYDTSLSGTRKQFSIEFRHF